MTKILRDRISPYTLQPHAIDLFDDNSSPGNNGALRQTIYDPNRFRFWVAASQPPVFQNLFVCFFLSKLLEVPGAVPCSAAAIESPC